MYKKFTFLISLLLLAGLAAGPALAADPVAYWNFNDGTAADSSGNGHHGTLSGSRISIIDDSERGSKVVDADNIAGTTNSVVKCGDGSWCDITDEITIAAWFTLENIHTSNIYMLTKGSAYQITSNGTSDGIRFYMSGLSTTILTTSTPVMDGKWHHLAVTYDSAAQERIIYIDGIPVADDTPSGSISTNNEELIIAGRIDENQTYDKRGWDGRLDDVRLYNTALTENEVRSLVSTGTAYNPSPPDGTGNVDIDAVLSWTPGDFAATTQGHDLYLGTNWADVNDGISAVHIGKQDNNSYDPDLQPGTTYFWVVDEVNDSHQDSPWLGTIWSFRTEGEGFFKDIFMDGGVNLTSRTTLPAAALLGLSMEFIATSTQSTQNNVMISNSNDDNGALLYPDGEPRFRCFYSNGGASIDHGTSLGETGRQRVRDFYYNGGSYTGSCAGSALATVRVTASGDTSPRTEYYRIWPSVAHYSQLADSYTGHDIPTGSPLLNYFDFGGDNYIYHVRHNGGNYVIEDDPMYWCTGTEVLATFAEPIEGDDTQYQPFMGNVSAWAYKDDADSGRIAICGSHPEGVTTGERREFQAAMFLYGMAGQGSPNVKAALSDGVTRQMNNNSSAGHEKIGDKQYHQFTIDVPSQTTQLTITLDGDDSYDLNLFTKQGDSAFKGGTGVTAATNGSGADEEIVKSSPAAGTWYIGVKCNTTVTSALHSSGEYYEYTGATGVLNGVAYSITATLGGAPTPGVTITESGGSTDVAEEGPTTDTYTVVLDSLPTATVTITVDPDIDTEVNNNGAGNSIDLTFLTTNWDTAQTVTVKAIDDSSVEGAHTSTITHTAASSDNDYDGISIDSVVANVTDNDFVAGVTITESGGSTDVDEEGPTTDTYTVVLDSLPTATVTITVDPDIETEVNNNGAGNSIDLTFLTTNWDTAQTVTVKAIDDEEVEGAHTSTITHTAASSDNNYNGISIDNVVANVTDNDVAGVTITESGGSTDVDEEGPTTDTYTVVLDTLPTDTVTITVDPDIDTEVNNNGAGNPVNLTFLTTNWDTAQTVTVTAIDDVDVEGAHTSTITHTAVSNDNDYDGISIDDVVANVTDNDQPLALPWSDGFESGNFTYGGWTIQNSKASVSSSVVYTGIYGAKLKKTTWIEKTISTEGFTSIHVKYRRKTKGLDSGENLYVEWSTDGQTWYNLETVRTASYGDGLQDKTCGTGANNNSGFRVRFRTNASSNGEYAGIDDVEITGTAL